MRATRNIVLSEELFVDKGEKHGINDSGVSKDVIGFVNLTVLYDCLVSSRSVL